ncbi:hypothetical protein G5B40_13410 [Pikeienuella piscinae]|uniref:Uncharacterized protein n=1 Tax=Pikeienuella piscinae TaxID=2748098 RepID=A0A7L5BY47_9RHOB|nr:hypothetical protein [Pikeienuella piscinae]QIE56371.1 hypothetical protein G5B40_13410 [Pikeienuella piscinae]
MDWSVFTEAVPKITPILKRMDARRSAFFSSEIDAFCAEYLTEQDRLITEIGHFIDAYGRTIRILETGRKTGTITLPEAVGLLSRTEQAASLRRRQDRAGRLGLHEMAMRRGAFDYYANDVMVILSDTDATRAREFFAAIRSSLEDELGAYNHGLKTCIDCTVDLLDRIEREFSGADDDEAWIFAKLRKNRAQFQRRLAECQQNRAKVAALKDEVRRCLKMR